MIYKDRETIKPCNSEIGQEFLHNYLEFSEPKKSFDEVIDKLYYIEPETLREKEMFIKGFLGDGSSGIYRYKKMKFCWNINNLDFNIIENLQRFCKEIWNDKDFKVYDVRETSHVYRIASGRKKLALRFGKFYTKDEEISIPYDKLNETKENKKWFFIGYSAADGNKKYV